MSKASKGYLKFQGWKKSKSMSNIGKSYLQVQGWQGFKLDKKKNLNVQGL